MSAWLVLGNNSAWCIVFLHILQAEALAVFALDYLFKNTLTGNSLG